MSQFASVLKQLRLQQHLTQPELALQLGISRSAVSMYEQGKREPDLDTLGMIAKHFGVDMNYLTGSAASQDEFTYALYEETKTLTEENKQKLLEMARFFKSLQK